MNCLIAIEIDFCHFIVIKSPSLLCLFNEMWFSLLAYLLNVSIKRRSKIYRRSYKTILSMYIEVISMQCSDWWCERSGGQMSLFLCQRQKPMEKYKLKIRMDILKKKTHTGNILSKATWKWSSEVASNVPDNWEKMWHVLHVRVFLKTYF